MTNRLKCPECGNDEFGQNRTTSYDEYCVVSFSLLGEVEDERIESQEGGTEEDAEAHHCCRCGWQLVDENYDPITEPDEVVAAFDAARLAHQKKNGKPADIEGGIQVNREDVIAKMVDQYREALEHKGDKELLGYTLDTLRENTVEYLSERYQTELEEQMKRNMEHYQEDLEQQSDEDLLGSTLEEVREDTIERLVEKYQKELESKSDHELIGGKDDSEQ